MHLAEAETITFHLKWIHHGRIPTKFYGANVDQFLGVRSSKSVKLHDSSFTHLGNSTPASEFLLFWEDSLTSLFQGFGWVGRNENCPSHPKPITSQHSAATPFSNCREPLFVKLRLLMRPLPLVKQRKHEGRASICGKGTHPKHQTLHGETSKLKTWKIPNTSSRHETCLLPNFRSKQHVYTIQVACWPTEFNGRWRFSPFKWNNASAAGNLNVHLCTT